MFTLMGAWMGQYEIADRLGVTRQRVQQLTARVDWPEPKIVLAMGKIWATDDIEAWIRDHRPDDPGADTKPDLNTPLRGGKREKKKPTGA